MIRLVNISPTYLPLLVWWSVITWPTRWSDPFSIWCTLCILLFQCLVHLISDIFNFCFAFVKFRFRFLGPCWEILSHVTSFVTTRACNLTQPSTIITSEMCSNVVLRDVSIFLTIMIVVSCIVIPIVRVVIASYLVWCPCRLGSTLKWSMSILLTVVVVSFKFGYLCDSGPTFMCLMSLLFALLIVSHGFWLCILICILTLANISCMSLSTVMTSRFGILTFNASFF